MLNHTYRFGRAAALALCWLVCLPTLTASGAPAQQGGSGDDSQRVELISRQGGPVTGAIRLSGNLTAASEGSALALVATGQGGSQVIERRELGHGQIVDLARCGDGLCALTVEGVVTLSGADGQGMPMPAGFAPGGGQAIAAQGDLALVAARQAGLRILRVGPGGAASGEVTLPLPAPALDVALDRTDNLAYVAGGEAGVMVVRLDGTPAVAAVITTVRPADAVALIGRLLAVSSGRRVALIDPAAGGQGPIGVYAPLADGRRIAIDGEYAYIADAHDGLKILWLAGPLRPAQVYGEIDRPAADVAIDKNTLYVTGPDGLRIYDVSSRTHPLQIAGLALPAPAGRITLADTRAFIALGQQGMAVVDVSNQSQPQLKRLIALGGPANASAYSDGALYVAAGEAGLAVIDASAPGSESLVSTLALPAPALDVAVRGDAAYVAAGEAGLISVDISRRQMPAIASALPPAAGQSDQTISISGKRGYVTQGNGFIVTDVSYPKSMGVLGTITTPASDIAASDIYLYALGGDQIAIYDARATAEPVYQRAYRGLRQASRITADGAHAFITSAVDGPDLVALDLSAPDAPVELDSAGETGHTDRADAGQGMVTLAAGLGGLRWYGLTDGGALSLQGSAGTTADASLLAASGSLALAAGQDGWSLTDLKSDSLLGEGPGSAIRALAADGDTAALAGEDSLEIVSLSGGRATPGARNDSSGPVRGLALSPEYVFAASPDGLAIFNRANLEQSQRIDLPSPPSGVALGDGEAYLPMANGSLAIVDVGDPSGGIRVLGSAATGRPAALIPGPNGVVYTLADTDLRRLALGSLNQPAAIEVGALPAVGERGMFVNGLLAAFTAGDALRFYDPASISGGSASSYGEIALNAEDVSAGWPLAYAAYGDGGLGLVDIPNRQPYPPFYSQPVDALAQDGHTLFAAGAELTAWDISTPNQPHLLATLPLDFRARHIDAAPGNNWLVSTEGGLDIVHWDGNSLTLAGSAALPGPVDRAIQIGGRGYAALHGGGLEVMDLSDPANPASLFTLTSKSGLYVHDLLQVDTSHLLVSWDGAVDVLDVSQPAPPPHLAGTFLLGGQADGIRVDQAGKRAALAMGEQGAAILDLSDPRQPKLVSRVETPAPALAAQLDGGALYLADGACGLRVFDVSSPTTPHEVGYWRGGYASDLALMPDGSPQPPVAVALGSQIAQVRYNPAGAAVLPPAPQDPQPPADDSSAPIELTLKWGPPPDPCNPLKYDVYFGQSDQPPLLGSVTGEPHIQVPQLAAHGLYTWHVDVTDAQGDQVSGPVWRFTTAGVDYANGYPPSPPLFLDWVEQHPLVSAGLVALFLAIPAVLFLRGLGRPSGVDTDGASGEREGDIPDWYEAGRDVGEMGDEEPKGTDRPE